MIKREYYKNGQIFWEAPHHQGQRHGIVKTWRADGQPRSEILYHQGQRHGIAKWWWWGRNGLKKYYLYDNEVTYEEYRRHELIEKLSGL